MGNQLWLRYKSTGDAELLSELISHYLPLVGLHAGRLAVNLPPNVSREDLAQAGVLGLMEALQRFDPLRGFKFETFASQRIRGAMLDELRRLSWLPRSLIRQMRELDGATQALATKLGRDPEDGELADELGISVTELQKIISQIHGRSLLSLEDTLFAHPSVEGPENDILGRMIDEEEKEQLAAAVESLPERQRLLLSLYYKDELTLKEIGVILGVSESRVCQLHAQVITRLRELLN